METLVQSGCLRFRSAPYIQPDGTTTTLNEIEINEPGMFYIIKNSLQNTENNDMENGCNILAYGEFHDILNNPTIFDDANTAPFDSKHKLGEHFIPQVTFNNVAKFGIGLSKTNYTSEETTEIAAWFSGLSEEDKKLFKDYNPKNFQKEQ